MKKLKEAEEYVLKALRLNPQFEDALTLHFRVTGEHYTMPQDTEAVTPGRNSLHLPRDRN